MSKFTELYESTKQTLVTEDNNGMAYAIDIIINDVYEMRNKTVPAKIKSMLEDDLLGKIISMPLTTSPDIVDATVVAVDVEFRQPKDNEMLPSNINYDIWLTTKAGQEEEVKGLVRARNWEDLTFTGSSDDEELEEDAQQDQFKQQAEELNESELDDPEAAAKKAVAAALKAIDEVSQGLALDTEGVDTFWESVDKGLKSEMKDWF